MNQEIAVRENQTHIAEVPNERMNGNKSIMRGVGGQQPLTMNELKFFGQMIHEAGLIPKTGNETTRQLEARAMAKVIAGHAYGFDPILSMRLFDVINGKLQPTSECVSVLIKRSGRYNYKVSEWTPTLCRLQFYEKNGSGEWKSAGFSSFSIDDAKKAGYIDGPNKNNWAKIPRNMLLARAITNGKRLFCADVMDPGGYFGASGYEVTEAVDTPDDLEFVDAPQFEASETIHDGEVVDTSTGEVLEDSEDVETEPAIDADESKLADLRTAALDAYRSTEGESRLRANKWLGKSQINNLDADGLKKFLEAFPSL